MYNLVLAKKKEDFFVAGSIACKELQVFEKAGATYIPTWTISDVDGGVLACDISAKNDRLAFVSGTSGKRVRVLNIGKVI